MHIISCCEIIWPRFIIFPDVFWSKLEMNAWKLNLRVHFMKCDTSTTCFCFVCLLVHCMYIVWVTLYIVWVTFILTYYLQQGSYLHVHFEEPAQ